MSRKTLPLKFLLATLALTSTSALAQNTITLRVSHFLPAGSAQQTQLIEPWCAAIQEQSQDRLKCQIYPSMQLGGSAPQLFDQVKDGVADVVWTLPNSQAGRFTALEVFELPFVVQTPDKDSGALWRYVQEHALKELNGVRPIALHFHDGSLLHTARKQVRTLEDMRDLKIRTPTRQATRLITALGATPISMPVPQVPEALSKGVIDGAMVPWEVAPSAKLHEVTKFHSSVDASFPQISNTVMLFGMNQARYDSLPDDLKKVIDDNSGEAFSVAAGAIFLKAGMDAQQVAQEHNNIFYTIPADEAERWHQAAAPVVEQWIKDADAKGYDGKQLLKRAQELIGN